MPISWDDIEAHRHRLTPLQWERFRAFILEGKTLLQIGGAGKNGFARSSLNQSIGRASIAMIRALLGQPDFHSVSPRAGWRPRRPQRVESPRLNHLDVHLRDAPLVQSNEQEPDSQTSAVKGTSGQDQASFLPFAGLRDLLSNSIDKRDHTEASNSPVCISPKMRVLGFNGTIKTEGKVEIVAGDKAVVIWDSGFKSFVATAELTPLVTASPNATTLPEQGAAR